MSDDLTIKPTPPQRHKSALELLFATMSPSERVAQMATTMAALRDGRLSLDGLLEAVRNDATVGSIWASVMGGGAALLWPPQIASREDESTALALLSAADAWMGAAGVRLANAFITDDQSIDARRLEKVGYTCAAEILYLVSERSSFPQEAISTPLEFEPFSDDEQDRLAAIVERTYEGTLDCPLLNGPLLGGQRDIADILEGYRLTGVYDPGRWLRVSQQGVDAGCLILTDHPGEDQWELVYQGVVPAARGSGFGLDMIRHAQWLTGRAGRSRLVLAVDADNRPAIAGYTAAGFQQWDRRYVYVKFVDGNAEHQAD